MFSIKAACPEIFVNELLLNFCQTVKYGYHFNQYIIQGEKCKFCLQTKDKTMIMLPIVLFKNNVITMFSHFSKRGFLWFLNYTDFAHTTPHIKPSNDSTSVSKISYEEGQRSKRDFPLILIISYHSRLVNEPTCSSCGSCVILQIIPKRNFFTKRSLWQYIAAFKMHALYNTDV